MIDEYEFLVQPVLAGHGPTLLAGLRERIDSISLIAMSSGRGRSPCDTGPPELRLDVIVCATLAIGRQNLDLADTGVVATLVSAPVSDVVATLASAAAPEPACANRAVGPITRHATPANVVKFLVIVAPLWLG